MSERLAMLVLPARFSLAEQPARTETDNHDQQNVNRHNRPEPDA